MNRAFIVVPIVVLLCLVLYIYCCPAPYPVRHVHDQYAVVEIHHLLSPSECRILQQQALQHGLEPSTVVSNGIGKDDNVLAVDQRQSVQVWLPDTCCTVAQKLANVCASLSALPLENQEMLQVVRYNPGGQFKVHHDAYDTGDMDYVNRMNRYAGQRKCTLLVYLNDVDPGHGGETEFVGCAPSFGPFRPVAGKAIFFYNTDANDGILPLSAHCGHPVLEGEKWIATKWAHPGKYAV